MAINFGKLSEADAAAVAKHFNQDAPKAKPSKFHNVVTVADEVVFSSKKEARLWHELKAREAAGGIRGLRRQLTWNLHVNGQHICDYVSDFEYQERWGDEWRPIVADVKGGKATKTRGYEIKKKLMLAVHGVAIVEL